MYMLGKGSHGRVFRAELSGAGTTYAIKVIDRIGSETEHESILMRYLTINCPDETFYPAIVQTAFINNKYYIVMEDLDNYLSLYQICRLSLQHNYHRKNTVLLLFQVVKRMHELSIVHLDLSASNVLLPSFGTRRTPQPGELKIVDYATARLVNGIGNRLGVDRHRVNVTTANVISPFTALLHQNLLPEGERIDMIITGEDVVDFYHMSDLWSVFHLACFFLNLQSRFFSNSEELLEHLKVKNTWDQNGHPVAPYLMFYRDVFYQNESLIDLLYRYLSDHKYFLPSDTTFLANILRALLSYNIDTYVQMDHRSVMQRILGKHIEMH